MWMSQGLKEIVNPFSLLPDARNQCGSLKNTLPFWWFFDKGSSSSFIFTFPLWLGQQNMSFSFSQEQSSFSGPDISP